MRKVSKIFINLDAEEHSRLKALQLKLATQFGTTVTQQQALKIALKFASENK